MAAPSPVVINPLMEKSAIAIEVFIFIPMFKESKPTMLDMSSIMFGNNSIYGAVSNINPK